MIAPKHSRKEEGSKRRCRILFLLPSLAGGGAERVVTVLLRNLDRSRFDIHLGLAAGGGAYRNLVPADVPVYDLGATHVRFALPKLARLLRWIRPDTVFATLDHMNLAVMLLRPWFSRSMRFVIRPANTLSEASKQFRWPALPIFLYRKLYPHADCIICQSDYMREELLHMLGPSINAKRIYNPVDADAITEQARRGSNPFHGHGPGPHVVTAGRLAREKGVDRILARLPQWMQTHPDLQLWILGEGSEKAPLQRQARELGVLDHVHFQGFQENPYRWFRHADLFVLASLYEGLPNVLLEALASGCPSVATASPGGTPEVARHVGDKFCKLVHELPERFPEMRLPVGTTPDLELFRVENALSHFSTVFEGGEE